MYIYVKRNNDGIITAISSGYTTSIANWITVTNFNSLSESLSIGSEQISYKLFVKYFYQFTINTSGVVAFKSGVTSATLGSEKLTTLDMSVPMSFTRANTIVNFGRL